MRSSNTNYFGLNLAGSGAQTPGDILAAKPLKRKCPSRFYDSDVNYGDQTFIRRLHSTVAKVWLLSALAVVTFAQQPEAKAARGRFPLNFDVNVGGMTPSGAPDRLTRGPFWLAAASICP